jgi:NADPH2:quinone reductase
VIEAEAWRLTAFGEPHRVVRRERLVLGPPPDGQVLVRVLTAGAGYPDAMMAAGAFPLLSRPLSGLGEEVAGEVVAVAPRSRFEVGDRIMGVTAFLSGWGGYAEFTYVVEQSAARVPERFTDEEAGGFPIAFRTACAALVDRAGLREGETVMVLGAAGSSGAAAVELAKALGAEVIAVAGSDEKLQFARQAGADHVVSHRTDDLAARVDEITAGRGVDLVYDVVGGPTAATATRTLARHGRMVVVGWASGTPVELNTVDMLLRNWSAVGVLASGHTARQDVAIWDRLLELADRGLLDTPVGTVWPFADVSAMIAQQGAPGPGKSVVRVGERSR